MPSSIGSLALQRIVGHRIDGLDDVRVVFHRVVNQRGAAGLLLAQILLQSEPSAAGQTGHTASAGHSVPAPREPDRLRRRSGNRAPARTPLHASIKNAAHHRIRIYRLFSLILPLLAHDIGNQLIVDIRNLLDHCFDRLPGLKAHLVAKPAQAPDQCLSPSVRRACNTCFCAAACASVAARHSKPLPIRLLPSSAACVGFLIPAAIGFASLIDLLIGIGQRQLRPLLQIRL